MWLYTGSSKRADRTSSASPTTSRRHRTSSSTTSSTTTTRPTSPGSTLAEVLRRNPFRAGSKETVSQIPEEQDASVLLNKDLLVLAEFFPDVKVEVLRELLLRFDGDSRLPICTEQLYKYKSEWAKGRLNVPPRGQDEPIPAHELFRTKQYVDAVKWAVSREFAGLSRSAVEAVLAEVNFSYTDARPILQGLASKSWKVTFTSIFRRKGGQDSVPPSLLDRTRADPQHPKLLASGSEELDKELAALFKQHVVQGRPKGHETDDLELAQALNQREAEEAGTLFECQVCYNEVAFEDAAMCTQSEHTICLECVRRTVHEAIFGQGWAKSVDVEHGTLKCLAAASATDTCDGRIAQDLVRRAVLRERSGSETWTRFEDRLAEHNLQQSGLPLLRCPFCSYAEVEQIYDRDTAASARTLTWRLRRPSNVDTFTFILLLELLPALLLLLIPPIILFPNYFATLFYTALAHLALSKRTTRFVCKRPRCGRKSCLKCFKAWHDPHVCHEPLIVSLRTTVEAARTAAVKRTCPRCGTSFVKSSGCNKLTCVCGYSMCYLCRKNIGKAGGGGAGGAAGGGFEGEGYRHFCEHFRPLPGMKCTECDKCDLYQAEDEDLQVLRAGEEAERLWREREGMVGVKGLEDAVGNLAGEENSLWKRVRDGRWTVQGVVDAVVERCVVVTID
ncbi:hypothetical protein HRR83_001736 [Exophiala dermatitidis]|uniref:RING-type domain-containing protein n=1 Tax=Exophiala dermatitidis TaxID=5970 RepID=A0AAN6F3R6_EXODE|nr:hypothetical protein HRR73_004870 [Exophiala dermatitidis]KAJ4523206.1 hypothetical protein HRR75_001605 [Exophiala dermatitidis]KAJ4526542.1 hypothetical protein HRR74_001740 [Exophiala dermatitidis]KAJ4532211.1 hypothetical protein HRR76_007210 [Exophiala dermatitidis]KAJ4546247.1 hypothetical protein HRR77_004783 [Exophiala dermatitidis]